MDWHEGGSLKTALRIVCYILRCHSSTEFSSLTSSVRPERQQSDSLPTLCLTSWLKLSSTGRANIKWQLGQGSDCTEDGCRSWSHKTFPPSSASHFEAVLPPISTFHFDATVKSVGRTRIYNMFTHQSQSNWVKMKGVPSCGDNLSNSRWKWMVMSWIIGRVLCKHRPCCHMLNCQRGAVVIVAHLCVSSPAVPNWPTQWKSRVQISNHIYYGGLLAAHRPLYNDTCFHPSPRYML